jgi:hypothetical protein
MFKFDQDFFVDSTLLDRVNSKLPLAHAATLADESFTTNYFSLLSPAVGGTVSVRPYKTR